jgi:hypothetical protein
MNSDSSHAKRETVSMMEIAAVNVYEGLQNFCGDTHLLPIQTQAQVFGNQIIGITANET